MSAESRFDAAFAVITDELAKPDALIPGAVLTILDGDRVQSRAAGLALKYRDESAELPATEQIPVGTDTIFDLASISKLFTSIVAMQLVERGELELDRPAANYLQEYDDPARRGITVRHLLTHTTGLPPFLRLWIDYPDRESRLHAALTARGSGEGCGSGSVAFPSASTR